jgi:RNase P/RNase MRP subunit p29
MVIIFTIYVITAAEAYGLFSRVVKFTFNYLQIKKKKNVTQYKKKFLVYVTRYNKKVVFLVWVTI